MCVEGWRVFIATASYAARRTLRSFGELATGCKCLARVGSTGWQAGTPRVLKRPQICAESRRHGKVGALSESERWCDTSAHAVDFPIRWARVRFRRSASYWRDTCTQHRSAIPRSESDYVAVAMRASLQRSAKSKSSADKLMFFMVNFTLQQCALLQCIGNDLSVHEDRK